MDKKYIIALMFWISLAVMMLIGQFFKFDAWYLSLQKVLVPGFIGYWVQLDAIEREWEKERVIKYAVFSLFFPPITVPIYLVKTRGWKGLGRFIWNFLLYSIAFLIIMSIAIGIINEQ